jgi:hypothetical protein
MSQTQTIFHEPKQTERVCDAAKKPTTPVCKNIGVPKWNTNRHQENRDVIKVRQAALETS